MNTPSTSLTRHIGLALLTLSLAAAPIAAQTVDLNFSNPVGTPNANNASLGPYFTSLSLNFTNVAPGVDMTVQATTWGSISFTGHFADYNSLSSGEPNDDLGVYYAATATGLGGVHYQMNFYQSGTNFTTPYTISQLQLMLYDVDGESNQSEMLKAYTADGLASYQTGNDASSVTASPFAGGVLFTGPGQNYAETDVSGAFILTYQNTDSILLDFQANTTGISNMSTGNPVFSAIDGDLSMLNGETSGFTSPQVVPEPSGALLLGIAGMFALLRRRVR